MKLTTLLTNLFLASSIGIAPAAIADPGHGKGHGNKEWKQQKQDKRHYQQHDDDREQRKVDHKRIYNNNQYLTKDQFSQVPPGLQKNVARGKAVPPGWAKKLDNRYYTVNQYNGKNVYILDRDAYNRATVISRPRAGEVRVRIDNRVLDVIEVTRVILNVL